MKRRANREGSLFQNKQGYWVGQVSLPNGKLKRKYSKTQREAREWLQSQRSAIRDGVWTDSDSVTVAAFLDRYMEDVGANTLRPKTLETYLYLIRLHIKPEIGAVRLSALTPSHVQHLYTVKLNQGLSRRTVQFIHSVIHKAFDQAVRWGLMTRNVCDLADAPKPKRQMREVWSIEQVKTFLEYVRHDRLYALWVLAMTGMRLGELLGVRYEDVNWKDGTLHVTQAIQYIPGKGLFTTEPKTEHARRTIKLPRFVFEVLKTHVKEKDIKSGLLFTTRNGTPFSPRNIERYFSDAIKGAGVPSINFHRIRHTVATTLLLANTHPKLVQELLGHSTISMTLDTYSHVIPQMHDEAANKINEMLV